MSMNCWIFKVSDLGQYADAPGEQYVFDNTHSVRVRAGDEFLYLEKAGATYGLTGAGRVDKVVRRAPYPEERHNDRVTSVFTAHLSDLAWFSRIFSLSSRTKAGRINRRQIQLPDDLNAIGWSISMPRLERDLFVRLLDAAMEAGPPTQTEAEIADWRVEDSWSLVRQRRRLQRFRAQVLNRHNHTCLICGTGLRCVLEVAHLRSYAGHPEHRANPANGACMCRYCHGAFDAGAIVLHADGTVELKLKPPGGDLIAEAHFGSIPTSRRRLWLAGIDPTFLTVYTKRDFSTSAQQ